MSSPAGKGAGPLVLICGDDEFHVKERSKELYQKWSDELGGMDHEIIDAAAANSGEALKALARLREALQTLPFFGSDKVIWLRDCNFLGDERAASTQAVTETLSEISQELKDFGWSGKNSVRLLISAGKVDKRKTFYKTIEKLGAVENFSGWSVDDRDWADQAEQFARRELRARKKEISGEALSELINRVGANARMLANEIEKLTVYVGQRNEIGIDDVSAVCIRNRAARAFALGDALGDRDLPYLLRCLDEELWEVKLDPKRNEIGLLYGLISKVRALLLLKEMAREGWIKAETHYPRFKAQLERVPADQLPADKRYNPLALNPYVLFKALPQIKNYSQSELVAAMELLLKCNRQLIFSNLDESLALQQTLIKIVGSSKQRAKASVI